MSTIQDIVNEDRRARILCVGRSGVGKSSLINRVLGSQLTSVSHYNMGDANIERGYPSDDNFLVLHDSRGFQPGDTQSFDIVAGFIKRRCSDRCPPEDRLHAVWLCMEHPIIEGLTFDQSDKKLLQLARETQIPVMIVLTKFDRIIRRMRAEAVDNYKGMDPKTLDQRVKVKEDAQKLFDNCVQSLDNAGGQRLRCVKVAIPPGYDADISSLVEVTGDHIHENSKGDAWLLWVIAHRASLPLTLDACIFAVMAYYTRDLARNGSNSGRISLRDFLTKVHQDIITCWDSNDKSFLSSEKFKKFMLLLVQDIEQSPNQGQSQSVSSQAIDPICQVLNGISDMAPEPVSIPDSALEKSLSDLVSGNKAQAQRLLMTYAVDLIALLRSLFDAKGDKFSVKRDERVTWLDLKRAYNASGSRQEIHSRIRVTFRDQRILTDRFERMYAGLVKGGAEDAGGPAPSLIRTDSRNSPLAGWARPWKSEKKKKQQQP